MKLISMILMIISLLAGGKTITKEYNTEIAKDYNESSNEDTIEEKPVYDGPVELDIEKF